MEYLKTSISKNQKIVTRNWGGNFNRTAHNFSSPCSQDRIQKLIDKKNMSPIQNGFNIKAKQKKNTRKCKTKRKHSTLKIYDKQNLQKQIQDALKQRQQNIRENEQLKQILKQFDLHLTEGKTYTSTLTMKQARLNKLIQNFRGQNQMLMIEYHNKKNKINQMKRSPQYTSYLQAYTLNKIYSQQLKERRNEYQNVKNNMEAEKEKYMERMKGQLNKVAIDKQTLQNALQFENLLKNRLEELKSQCMQTEKKKHNLVRKQAKLISQIQQISKQLQDNNDYQLLYQEQPKFTKRPKVNPNESQKYQINRNNEQQLMIDFNRAIKRKKSSQNHTITEDVEAIPQAQQSYLQQQDKSNLIRNPSYLSESYQ